MQFLYFALQTYQKHQMDDVITCSLRNWASFGSQGSFILQCDVGFRMRGMTNHIYSRYYTYPEICISILRPVDVSEKLLNEW